MSDLYDELEMEGGTEVRGRRARKSRMKELLLLLPRMVRLIMRLARDPRVSRADKVFLGGTILYVLVPLDFLPDMIPFVGQIDDAYLVAVSILRMLNRADPAVIAKHWDGDVDIKKLATSIASVATYFLPAAMKNALSARIEVREPKRLRPGQLQQQQQAQTSAAE